MHSSDEESSDSEPELSPLFSPLASDDEDSDDEDDEDSDDESSDAGDCDDEDSDSEEFSDEDPRIDEDETMDTINEESMDCSLQPHQGETNSCGMFILYEHDNIIVLRWRDTKINDIHDFTGYCYFHDKTELGGCFLHSVLLALSLGPD